jgi:hypothetical protein
MEFWAEPERASDIPRSIIRLIAVAIFYAICKTITIAWGIVMSPFVYLFQGAANARHFLICACIFWTVAESTHKWNGIDKECPRCHLKWEDGIPD